MGVRECRCSSTSEVGGQNVVCVRRRAVRSVRRKVRRREKQPVQLKRGPGRWLRRAKRHEVTVQEGLSALTRWGQRRRIAKGCGQRKRSGNKARRRPKWGRRWRQVGDRGDQVGGGRKGRGTGGGKPRGEKIRGEGLGRSGPSRPMRRRGWVDGRGLLEDLGLHVRVLSGVRRQRGGASHSGGRMTWRGGRCGGRTRRGGRCGGRTCRG